MFFQNWQNYEIIIPPQPEYETILLILSTFIIGVWLLYISTKDYQKESTKLIDDVIVMRNRIGNMCSEIGAITKHCDEQYNIMNKRLKEIQNEIERHLSDIDQIERLIINKTNSECTATEKIDGIVSVDAALSTLTTKITSEQ